MERDSPGRRRGVGRAYVSVAFLLTMASVKRMVHAVRKSSRPFESAGDVLAFAIVALVLVLLAYIVLGLPGLGVHVLQ